MEKVPETGTLIEGIGDEVVWGIIVCSLTTCSIFMSLYIWSLKRNAQQFIHPASQENVQTARDRLRAQNRLPPERVSTRQRDEDADCPICLTPPAYGVETNCGHVFCGMCIITYWQSGTWLGSIRCPVCRQNVTLMLFLFTEDETNTSSAERDNVISNINTYNRRFSGEPRSFTEHMQDLPMLLRHLWGEFWSVNGTGMVFVFRLRVFVLFLFALMYFISPLDLIPEAVFGLLGFLDDFFILVLLIVYLSIIYRRVVAARAAQAAAAEASAAAAAEFAAELDATG